MAGNMQWWSIPYGAPAADPFWGPQTSAVNFCEEDYIVTRYIGEFWNTVTSLIYIAYGIHGIRRSKSVEAKAFDLVNLPYWGLIGVGIFSGLYHATLKYHTQMADELSMHLAIGMVLQRVYTFEQPLAIQRRNTGIILAVLVPFFIYHCVADEFAVHVILFGAMCIIISRRTQHLIGARLAPGAPARTQLAFLARLATASAILAYALWNVDVHACEWLGRTRRALGMPWGILLELHGYWHLLTGVAAYTFMAIIEVLTAPVEGEGERGSDFAWPARRILEEVTLTPPAEDSMQKAS